MQNHNDELRRSIIQVPQPEFEITYGMWETAIKQNFPGLVIPAEISLSIITQVLIQDVSNPFALIFMGPPASGKTIVINFFAGIKELTYVSDHFTPNAFVSGASNVKTEKLDDVDLLPRIRHKMLLVRELATIFSKRDEDLTELMGKLTRVLDGEGLTIDMGTHGQRGYTGDYLFMLLGASTAIRPRIWKIMGNLGSRIFFYRMNGEKKTERELAMQLTTQNYKLKERVCNQMTKNFLYTLWLKYPYGVDWNREKDSEELKIVIATIASLLARLRGIINVWTDDSNGLQTIEHKEPNIENPDRINQLFYNLARGHALAQGRMQITEEDLFVVVEVAIDSPHTMRSKLFRKLLDANGAMTTAEVAEKLDCSDTVARKVMKDLIDLEVCVERETLHDAAGRPQKAIVLHERWQWFLSEQCKKIRSQNKKDNTASANERK